MKIYFVRHQAGGVLWEFPMLNEPSIEQQAAIERICGIRYKPEHPKTGQPYWMQLIAVDVLNDGEIPKLPEPRDDSRPRGGHLDGVPVELSGVARVDNPSAAADLLGIAPSGNDPLPIEKLSFPRE